MDKIDDIDKSLIRALQKNARSSLKDLSNQINLSLPSTSERLRKLEKNGYIIGYKVLLDRQKLGQSITCFCMIVLKEQNFDSEKEFRKLIKQRTEIVECHCITGEYEYILKIVTESTRTLERLLESFREDFSITKSYTYAVLSTIKEEPGFQL